MEITALDGRHLYLKTSDEILCSGRGKLSKLIIEYNLLAGAQGAAIPISHVAKYIGGRVYEATTLNAWCGKKGYQANPFDMWLTNYNGNVWIRQTELCSIDEARYQQDADKDLGTPYENGIPGVLELLLTRMALKHGPKWLKEFAHKHLRTKNLHCSEGNVIRSQAGGYYDLKIRANKMPPYTFWDGGLYEKGFLIGKLRKAVQIK